MPTAIVKTREELEAWRDRLMSKIPAEMGKDEFYDLGRNYELRADERAVYETLRTIDYLLGDD